MSDLKPKVHLEEYVYQKIMHWCRKAGNYEVSGLGNVVYDQKTNTFTVNEVYLLEQENTGTSTDINEEALGKLMYEHHKSKIKGELRFWWHSHANMNVFWSGTDMATIKQLGQEGWFLSTVFNNKEEMKSAFYMTDPMTIFSDDLDTRILQSFGDKDVEKALASINLQLKSGKIGEFRWLVEPFASDREQLSWDEEYDNKVKVKKWNAPSAIRSGFGAEWPLAFRGHLDPDVNRDDELDNLRRLDHRIDTDPLLVSEADHSFPDYEPKGKYSLTDRELAELIEDIDDTIARWPGSTRAEIIDMYEEEHPYIADIITANYKGLRNE